MGLVFGTSFALTRRIIVLPIAHAATDVVAVLIVDFDLEPYGTHVVFS